MWYEAKQIVQYTPRVVLLEQSCVLHARGVLNRSIQGLQKRQSSGIRVCLQSSQTFCVDRYRSRHGLQKRPSIIGALHSSHDLLNPRDVDGV